MPRFLAVLFLCPSPSSSTYLPLPAEWPSPSWRGRCREQNPLHTPQSISCVTLLLALLPCFSASSHSRSLPFLFVALTPFPPPFTTHPPLPADLPLSTWRGRCRERNPLHAPRSIPGLTLLVTLFPCFSPSSHNHSLHFLFVALIPSLPPLTPSPPPFTAHPPLPAERALRTPEEQLP